MLHSPATFSLFCLALSSLASIRLKCFKFTYSCHNYNDIRVYVALAFFVVVSREDAGSFSKMINLRSERARSLRE